MLEAVRFIHGFMVWYVRENRQWISQCLYSPGEKPLQRNSNQILPYGFPFSICKFISYSLPFLFFIFLPYTSNQAVPSSCVCRKLISSVSFANQPLWGFLALFPEGCFIILLPKKRVNVQSAYEKHCCLISLVQGNQSNRHARVLIAGWEWWKFAFILCLARAMTEWQSAGQCNAKR